jgi:hypothetical protein
MSANRVQKTSSRSKQKKSTEKVLSEYVRTYGPLSPTPCANCFRSGRECRVAPGSHRCSECIARKVFCDGSDVTDRCWSKSNHHAG